MASTITKRALQSGMGAETARRVSAFRAFRTGIGRAFGTFHGSFVSIDVLLTWGTSRFTHLFVEHRPREIGQSNYTVRKLLTHAINMMTGFSTLPLQVATSIIAIFSGTQLFALGVIGEYLARMHFRLMDRPAYAVRQERPEKP